MAKNKCDISLKEKNPNLLTIAFNDINKDEARALQNALEDYRQKSAIVGADVLQYLKNALVRNKIDLTGAV